MWETEHVADTDVSVDRIWQTFIDVHSGRRTLPGGDVFAPEGHLGVGVRIAVTPAGQDTMTSVVTEFEPPYHYSDRTDLDGFALTFRHTFDPTGAGTRIRHQLQIDGALADRVGPDLGPQISADFAAQMDALIAAARTP